MDMCSCYSQDIYRPPDFKVELNLGTIAVYIEIGSSKGFGNDWGNLLIPPEWYSKPQITTVRSDAEEGQHDQQYQDRVEGYFFHFFIS
jgi:hypothetical protein